MRRSLGAAVLFLVALLGVAHADERGYAELVRRVAPSVVTILVHERPEAAGQRAVERATANTDSEQVGALLRRMLSGPEAPSTAQGGMSQGSGFIIRPDGLVVTNRHVIAAARSIKVKLTDGQILIAKLIGSDAPTDIALLKVDASGLPTLNLGSSEDLAVGDVVVAIGNPFGLGQSVTAGILSARGRTLIDDPYIDFLQTDAAINFGNSGGPLLAANGDVVGVTSAILSPTGGSVGLGFAIPAETVRGVIGELEAHGHVDRGYLGISVQPVTPAIARALGLKSPEGALVTAVEPEGPAGDALHVGDVLLRIGTTPVTFEHLSRIAGRLRPGTTVEARVVRDGVSQQVPLLTGQLPEPTSDTTPHGGADTWVPALEMGVAKSTGAVRKALKAGEEPAGLIVTQLRPSGAGAMAGLRVGDLITYAGSKHLEDVADLAHVGKPSAQLPLLLLVLRDGMPRFVAVTTTEEDN